MLAHYHECTITCQRMRASSFISQGWHALRDLWRHGGGALHRGWPSQRGESMTTRDIKPPGRLGECSCSFKALDKHFQEADFYECHHIVKTLFIQMLFFACVAMKTATTVAICKRKPWHFFFLRQSNTLCWSAHTGAWEFLPLDLMRCNLRSDTLYQISVWLIL